MRLFWLRFAARTLLRRRARTGVTLVAIALGVGSLTFIGGIMAGVNDAMIANSVSLHTGHALVTSSDAKGLTGRWAALTTWPPQVRAVLPRQIAPAMLATESGGASVQLIAVLPQRETMASAIPARITDGHYLSVDSAAPEIVLGHTTAAALHVAPGGSVRFRLAEGGEADARVVGVFRTGVERFDEGAAYMAITAFAALRPVHARGEVAVFFRRSPDPAEAAAVLAPLLAPGEKATHWQNLLPELEQLTRLNVVSMAIVIILVVVIMAAGVSNAVLVSVLDRYRDFGILKALGTTPWEILRLIVLETALLALVAGALGLALGGLATAAFARFGIDLASLTSQNPHFVLTSIVFPRLTWAMAVAPALASLGAGVVASVWPALIAARRRAADVMRYAQ